MHSRHTLPLPLQAFARTISSSLWTLLLREVGPAIKDALANEAVQAETLAWTPLIFVKDEQHLTALALFCCKHRFRIARVEHPAKTVIIVEPVF